MAKEKKQDEVEFLAIARERARDGATYWKDNWEAAEDDLKFLAGEQWPSQVRTERELEQRPCLTNNVLPTYVDQILGDQRQNRPSIKVSAKNPVRVPQTNKAGKEELGELKVSNVAGTKQYTLAEIMSGRIRSIENDCDAETSYDIAFQGAVECSMGFLRVRTDYINADADDEGVFDQDIIIDHIENQFSVTLDPSAKERDYHDQGWCLVDDQMLKTKFVAEYPGKKSEPLADDGDFSAWFGENTVRVTEYYTREPFIQEVALMSDGKILKVEDLEKIGDELAEQEITVTRTRKVKTFKVFWRKITGFNVLEGPVEVACSTIPIVPVWGKCITIKKNTIFLSLIRHSKDAQRMANYWDSAATETIALAPKAPFIGTAEHIEGYEDEWKNANTTNASMLTYNAKSPTDPGPKRQQPAIPPTAELALGATSVDKIKSTLGMFDASIGAQGNETSGRAIVARQRQGDRGSFPFIDNLSRALKRVGKIIVEMEPRVSDTERVHRMRFQDGTDDYVKLNEQIFDDESGEWVKINDLGILKYDVTVTTGPSYSTQRIEAAESMIQFATAVPAAAAVMADLIAQNMDWPGADTIAQRLKKIVPPEVLTQEERDSLQEDAPDEEEKPPTPEEQIQMAELEVKQGEIEADMATANAKIKQAEATEFKAQLESARAQRELSMINAEADNGVIPYQQVRELVAQALAELEVQNQQSIGADTEEILPIEDGMQGEINA